MPEQFQITTEPPRILHVEDCEDDHHLLTRHFQKNEFPVELQRVETREDFEFALNGAPAWGWDVILCDHHLPTFGAPQALGILKNYRLDIPFLIVSGAIGEMGVLEAMKAGAHDYIHKDNLLRLIPAIRRGMEEVVVRKAKAATDEQLRVANGRLRNAVETLTTTQDHLSRIERLRALGEIASGVAHDFNNSLSKILGITEILKDRCPGEDSALQDLLSVVHDSSRVVQRLRNFYLARPASDDSKPVDVIDLLNRCVELTRPKWQGRQMRSPGRLRCEVISAEVANVFVDDSELREVITNLIFNSVDAMEEQESGLVSLSAEERHGMVTILVTDNGSGMTPEVLQRCRNPFFTTKGENGTGLGLGLADSVIRRFGGKLKIESQLGNGTCVKIHLPIAEEEIGTQPRLEVLEEPTCSRRFRVLVVDDDPTILRLMKSLLELDGHQVVGVPTGADALREFDPGEWEVVITDCDMPIMDGFELGRRLKDLAPLVPVVMSTGHSAIEDGEWRRAVDYLLPKPVSRSGLRRVLSQVSLALVS